MTTNKIIQSAVNAALVRDVLGADAPQPEPEPRRASVLMALNIVPRDPDEAPEITKQRIAEWLQNADEIKAIEDIHINVFGERQHARWIRGDLLAGALGNQAGGDCELLALDGGDNDGQIVAILRQLGTNVWEARCILSPERTFNSLYGSRAQALSWLERCMKDIMSDLLTIRSDIPGKGRS